MTINKYTVGRMAYIMPAQEAITLNSRQSSLDENGENDFTAYAYPYCRREPAKKDIIPGERQLGEVWWRFQIYDTSAVGVQPKSGDQIIDVNGVVYQVREVEIKMLQTIYDCICLQNVGA